MVWFLIDFIQCKRGDTKLRIALVDNAGGEEEIKFAWNAATMDQRDEARSNVKRPK